MSETNAKFWIDLLSLSEHKEYRTRCWNGYLGWKLPLHIKEDIEPQNGFPKLIVVPPDGGWPKLTKKEMAKIEMLAEHFGGHPKFDKNYMNFSRHSFDNGIDFSGLTFVNSKFNRAKFGPKQSSFREARFYGQTYFSRADFANVDFYQAKFNAPVDFVSSRFNSDAMFIGVNFMGGASFRHASFKSYVNFGESKFKDDFFTGSITFNVLVNFSYAEFLTGASFRGVLFGNNDKKNSKKLSPERIVDFSDADFKSATDFRGAVFAGVPAFFNTTLHEDTNFGRIDWKKAEINDIPAEYAIRAWERLELMMSKLEKPLERHQFFRLKMRARRRVDNYFLRCLNKIFEVTADYGWSVWRAFLFWFGHWLITSLVLYLNAGTETIKAESWKLAKAALGTGFANAHAFLGLATREGYLEECKKFIEDNDVLGLLTVLGTIGAFFGPIFLFLLLLTLRNRFRLA